MNLSTQNASVMLVDPIGTNMYQDNRIWSITQRDGVRVYLCIVE